MKPILFNTEMVRALLDGRKSVTRRVVKPRYCDSVFEMYQGTLCEASPDKPPIENGDGTTTRFVRAYAPCKQPYQVGDILYVRETWQLWHGKYEYRADIGNSDMPWRPSIHMPKKAARLFLRVTDVRVERLQDMTPEQCIAEGIRAWSKDGTLYKYYPADAEGNYPDCSWSECPRSPKEAANKLWDSTIKKADLPLYGWSANPWVWVIEFERISKEEAMKGGSEG